MLSLNLFFWQNGGTQRAGCGLRPSGDLSKSRRYFSKMSESWKNLYKQSDCYRITLLLGIAVACLAVALLADEWSK
jgi:hypothetical protein